MYLSLKINYKTFLKINNFVNCWKNDSLITGIYFFFSQVVTIYLFFKFRNIINFKKPTLNASIFLLKFLSRKNYQSQFLNEIRNISWTCSLGGFKILKIINIQFIYFFFFKFFFHKIFLKLLLNRKWRLTYLIHLSSLRRREHLNFFI